MWYVAPSFRDKEFLCEPYEKDGEGWCDTYEIETWYGKDAMDCPYFKRKKAEEGE